MIISLAPYVHSTISYHVLKGEVSINSVLRYPGGKSRAVKFLKDYFPKDLESLVSPFFGGGSLEFHFAKQGVKIYGYDLFEPLVNFWHSLKFHKEELIEQVQRMYPITKEEFKILQNKLPLIEDKVISGAIFYVVNRSSFSGSTLSGGMSPNHPRFTQSSIDRLQDFIMDNVKIENLSFEESLLKHTDDFLYLDPPYYIQSKLYGNKGNLHKDFRHEELSNLLRKRKNWILSYNDCAEIREMYKGFEFIYPSWKYGMSNDKESKEILIVNY